MIGNIPWYDALQLLTAVGVVCLVVVQVIHHKLHGIHGSRISKEKRP